MNFDWLRQLDLRHDQNDAASIDNEIREGVAAAGTNLWVLIFAIVIASVGLNINSTAVIIGAMLISPLMGPIIGIGYGAGINDFDLIKQAFKSLGLFIFISLVSSTLYFLISPLSQAHSELFARTTPTLWDVLIAFFGGSAGILALTRKNISNVVPGVAIATALMPPLCAAGYGMASGSLDFFAGAFYLFSINSVFIALATLLFVKLLKLPKRKYVDEQTRQRTAWMITLAVLVTLLPSAYLAYKLVQQERFNQLAEQIIAEVNEGSQYILLGREVEARERKLLLTVGGDIPPEGMRADLEKRFARQRLPGTQVIIRYAGGSKVDVGSLQKELEKNIYSDTLHRITELEALQRQHDSERLSRQQLVDEMRAEFPEAKRIVVAEGAMFPGDGKPALFVYLAKPMTAVEKKRLTARLSVRFPDRAIELLSAVQ